MTGDDLEITTADRLLLCELLCFTKGARNYERVMDGTGWTEEAAQIARYRIAAEQRGASRQCGDCGTPVSVSENEMECECTKVDWQASRS